MQPVPGLNVWTVLIVLGPGQCCEDHATCEPLHTPLVVQLRKDGLLEAKGQSDTHISKGLFTQYAFEVTVKAKVDQFRNLE